MRGGDEKGAGRQGVETSIDGVSVPDARHFVYVLRCGDGTLYTGYTTDVERRLEEHANGDGAKYTRGRTPIELAHVEGFEDRSTAMAREHAIKSRSRAGKLALVSRDGAETDAGSG